MQAFVCWHDKASHQSAYMLLILSESFLLVKIIIFNSLVKIEFPAS